jgi:sigma-E factor negative regulatory protein RseA
MNEQLRESLSSLMDGEASEQDIQRVLENLQEPSVRDAWRHYHLLRWGLEGAAQLGGDDLSARIMAAVEQEPAHSMQPETGAVSIHPVGRWHRFTRPLASFAVAASVFAVVLVGSQFVDQGAGESGPVTADRSSPVGMVNTLGGAAVRAGYATRPVQVVPAAPASDYNSIARERLEKYMLPHAEEAALNAPQGMMPYARVATFRSEEERACETC